MSLKAIVFDRSVKQCSVSVLDQLLLPYWTKYLTIGTIDDGYRVIKSMQVRGAPAIAIVGVLAVLMECQLLLKESFAHTQSFYDLSQFDNILNKRLDLLLSSRPTAVNLANAITEIRSLVSNDVSQTYEAVYKYACNIIDQDYADNFTMGENGAQHLLDELEKEHFEGDFGVLTICNTGSLATSGYGTALGVIRSLHARTKHDSEPKRQKKGNAKLAHVYPLETRPYNQGSRLTAYELLHDEIPSTLITDSSISYLVSTSKIPIKAAFVGADRIVRNGDTANKIGTYQLSILCQHLGVKFYVVAPSTTFDANTTTGDKIIVEERPANEFRFVQGTLIDDNQVKPALDENKVPVKAKVGITPLEMPVWNPSFDITPYKYIDGIITEKGVFVKAEDGQFHLESIFE